MFRNVEGVQCVNDDVLKLAKVSSGRLYLITECHKIKLEQCFGSTWCHVQNLVRASTHVQGVHNQITYSAYLQGVTDHIYLHWLR